MHSSAYAVEVIVNSDTTPMEISKQQLKAIYMGQQAQWPNGIAVKLFVLNQRNKTHQNFVKSQLGLYPYQFNRRWQKLVFSGFAVKPTEVSSDKEMFELVAATPGSIGYVTKKMQLQGVNYATIK